MLLLPSHNEILKALLGLSPVSQLHNELLNPPDRKTIKKIIEGAASNSMYEKLLAESGEISPELEKHLRKRRSELDRAIDQKEITPFDVPT